MKLRLSKLGSWADKVVILFEALSLFEVAHEGRSLSGTHVTALNSLVFEPALNLLMASSSHRRTDTTVFGHSHQVLLFVEPRVRLIV